MYRENVMFTEKKTVTWKLGIVSGFMFSTTLFASIFFLIITAGKEKSVTMAAIAIVVTLGILLCGAAIKRLLR